MDDSYLSVIVIIPNGKEHYIDDLLDLAKKYKVCPKSENIETGTRFHFRFSDIETKNTFFSAVPVKWYSKD